MHATNKLAKSARQLRELAHQLEWLSGKGGVYHTYGYSGDQQVGIAKAQTDADLDAIRGVVKAMGESPLKSHTPPALPSLRYGTPALNMTGPATTQYFGDLGDDGDPFSIGATTMASVLNCVAIEAVTLWGWDGQEGPSVVYQMLLEMTDGSKTTVGTDLDGGVQSGPLTLRSGEFIRSVSGLSTRGAVGRLTLATASRKVSSGGDDLGGWMPFEYDLKENEVLVGFNGRSGKRIDRIGPCTIEFYPAIWDGPSPAKDAPSAADRPGETAIASVQTRAWADVAPRARTPRTFAPVTAREVGLT